MGGLRAIAGLLTILSSLVEMWKGWRLRQEARTEVEGEIAKKEAEIATKAGSIIAEQRSDDDTDKRLRDGTL